MSKSTTALLRRIEDEREAKRQEAWANRGRADHKLPVWACDTLLRNGDIGADLHDAAQRYRSAIERSQGVIGATGEKVDGGDGDPHARLWDASVARQVARTARSFVLATPCSLRKRAAVLDALFAFDGEHVTGPLPTMAKMRVINAQRYSADYAVKRIVGVLELLALHFTMMDRGYGR